MALSASIRTRLRHQHQTIRELTGDLSEQRLQQRLDVGKWSAFENIAHLTSYQPVFLYRLERIQKEDEPSFDRYVAENDPAFPEYVRQPLDWLFADIDQRRAEMLTLLEGMSDTALQRTGRHPRYGLLTIPNWTEFFLLHEAHHLYTIFMIVCHLKTK